MSSNWPEAACCSSSKNGPVASERGRDRQQQSQRSELRERRRQRVEHGRQRRVPERVDHVRGLVQDHQPVRPAAARPRRAGHRLDHAAPGQRDAVCVSSTTCSARIGDARRNCFTNPSATPACSLEVATSVISNSSPGSRNSRNRGASTVPPRPRPTRRRPSSPSGAPSGSRPSGAARSQSRSATPAAPAPAATPTRPSSVGEVAEGLAAPPGSPSPSSPRRCRASREPGRAPPRQGRQLATAAASHAQLARLLQIERPRSSAPPTPAGRSCPAADTPPSSRPATQSDRRSAVTYSSASARRFAGASCGCSATSSSSTSRTRVAFTRAEYAPCVTLRLLPAPAGFGAG